MTQILMSLQAVFMPLQHGCVYSFKLQINCKLKRTLGIFNFFFFGLSAFNSASLTCFCLCWLCWMFQKQISIKIKTCSNGWRALSHTWRSDASRPALMSSGRSVHASSWLSTQKKSPRAWPPSTAELIFLPVQVLAPDTIVGSRQGLSGAC